jgi:Cu(I)/Ag(I) efflux system membrane fusion protein
MSAVKIADLSAIWAVGEVFEYEMPAVRIGQAVTVEFPYGQVSKPLTGRVAFIYPDVDPQTRRGRIRVEFPNPGLTFKPGSFVTLTIRMPGGHELAVPREAVIDTGSTQYVILAREHGYFEPREITVGAPAGSYYPVLSGLANGERVVTSAQFLIDSETNLQAAMKAMAGHGMSPPAGSQDDPAVTAHSAHQK